MASEPTQEQLVAALQRADAEGDTQAAQAIASAIKQRRQQRTASPDEFMARTGQPQQQKPEYRGFSEEAVGLGETALTMGSGIAGQTAGGLAGLASLPFVGGERAAEITEGVSGAMTYEPRTDVGKRTIGGIGGLMAPVEEGLQEMGGRVTDDPVGTFGRLVPGFQGGVPGSQAISQQIPAELRALIGTGARVAPEAAGVAGGSRFLRPQRNAPNLEPGTKEYTLAKAEDAGYTVMPSQTADVAGVNRGGRAMLENLTKHAEVRRMATARNQKVTNRLAARALGLDKDRVTLADLDEVRAKANQSYSNIPKALEQLDIDDQYRGAVQALRAQKNQSFPAKINDQVDKLVDRLSPSDMPKTQDAMAIIRELRNDAKVNLKPTVDDPAKIELGYAQRAAADALEGLIGRNLERAGKGDLLQEFQNARQTLAKTHTVENAMVEGSGNVDPRAILRDKRKGVPLSGELDLIADTTGTFGDVMKATDSGVTARPFTATDLYFLSGSAAYGLGGMNPSAAIPIAASLAAPAGRMASLYRGAPTNPAVSGAGRAARGVGLFETLSDDEFQQMSGLMGR